MNILKTEEFTTARKLALFVNNNNIPKENIIIINTINGALTDNYVLFYYADSEAKEEVPGLFD